MSTLYLDYLLIFSGLTHLTQTSSPSPQPSSIQIFSHCLSSPRTTPLCVFKPQTTRSLKLSSSIKVLSPMHNSRGDLDALFLRRSWSALQFQPGPSHYLLSQDSKNPRIPQPSAVSLSATQPTFAHVSPLQGSKISLIFSDKNNLKYHEVLHYPPPYLPVPAICCSFLTRLPAASGPSHLLL